MANNLRIEPRTPLACADSALPLNYDNQTITSPHNPLRLNSQQLLAFTFCLPQKI